VNNGAIFVKVAPPTLFLMRSLLLFFLLLTVPAFSQEEGRGSIKLEKRGQLSKVQFDDVNYRLIAIDQYGNILDTAVVEFRMSVTIKGIFYSESVVGYALSYQMQQLLGKCDRSSVIRFDQIKARDRYGSVVAMPAFRYTFGYADESND
jgi:hypothetical protein